MQEKVKDCYGNACPRCRKCRDWYYAGNIKQDHQRWKRDYSCREIVDKSRWHSRPGATCILLPVRLHLGLQPDDAYSIGVGHCCSCP